MLHICLPEKLKGQLIANVTLMMPGLPVSQGKQRIWIFIFLDRTQGNILHTEKKKSKFFKSFGDIPGLWWDGVATFRGFVANFIHEDVPLME